MIQCEDQSFCNVTLQPLRHHSYITESLTCRGGGRGGPKILKMRLRNVWMVLRPDELCLEYPDCPSFPCFVQNCTKVPMIDVDTCLKSICWSPDIPILPNQSRYTIIVGSIVSIVVIGSILCFILRNKVKTCLKRTTHDGNDEEGIDSIAQGTIPILRNHLNHKSWVWKFQFLITRNMITYSEVLNRRACLLRFFRFSFHFFM